MDDADLRLVGKALTAMLEEKIAPLIAQIEHLEARVSALEAHIRERPGLAWRGVWRPGELYRLSDCVTFGGSMWVLTAGTSLGERPGDGPSNWKLCTKRGRDAKKARP